MKKYALSMVLVLVFSVSAFAGASAPVMERPIPVEEVKPAPAPAAPSDSAKPLVISKHGTWGLGLGGNPIIGVVEKDQYGYPRQEYTGAFYGINWALGFGVTNFNSPSAEQINAAVREVKAENPGITEKDIPSAVREKIGNSVTYTHLGTALLIIPVNAEVGIQWVINDSTRTRLGIGLPTLLCFGINWDI